MASGLSGYADAYMSAIKSGKSDSEAKAAANKAMYGSSSGPTTAAQIAQGLSGTGFSGTDGGSSKNNANNSSTTAANWARNVWGQGEYGPLTGAVGSRTMVTPAGIKKEGVDFYINPSDNRAYTYDWNSPKTDITQNLRPEEEQEFDPTEMINELKAAAMTEGPCENPDLVDDSENDNEVIK